MSGFFGYLLRTWFDRARGRWFGLVLAIVAVETPLAVFFIAGSWFDTQKLERLTTEGIAAEATVDGVNVRSGRYVTEVSLDLIWTDATGATRHKAARLSEYFAPTVASRGRALRPTLPIKYLPGEPDADVLFLDDAARQHEANRDLMSIGAVGLALCALALAILYAVRRHVRRKYPELPASFTSWPSFRTRGKGTNTFMRVYLQHAYFTAPLLVALIYGLKYIGLLEKIESVTGWSEGWAWFIVAFAFIATLSACGWCYDRYGDWRSQTQSQPSTPSVR
jgi:hypothetical protein